MEIQSELADGADEIEEGCIHAPWGESRICLCSSEGVDDEVLLHTVPYVDNEFVLNHVRANNNASASRMLLDLPRCRTNCEGIMSRAVSSLKNKRVRLLKHQDANGMRKLKAFLVEEFNFPPPREHARYVSIFH